MEHVDDEQLKTVIGRVEAVGLPTIGIQEVHARIDTGAQTSALWVSEVEEADGRLRVIFFGEGNPYYTGKSYYFDEFIQRMVASSNGQAELRYKIKLPLTLAGRRILAHFTLADRSTQVYPVLIGRNVLRGKFMVDVKRGDILRAAEKQRSQSLQQGTDHPNEGV